LFELALILASTSPIRRHMLDAAGVEYRAIPPEVDEGSATSGSADPEEVASELAAAKALAVSARVADAWVIGSDSVVSVAGHQFNKPANRDEAADHLRSFSGETMELVSAVALARRGEVEWSYIGRAMLHVRALSEEFIRSYLDCEWPEVGYCVGVFRMEGRGVQLFESIEGDHFTILGMPLIPLLGALRDRGLLRS
jgi:septum formation protein